MHKTAIIGQWALLFLNAIGVLTFHSMYAIPTANAQNDARATGLLSADAIDHGMLRWSRRVSKLQQGY